MGGGVLRTHFALILSRTPPPSPLPQGEGRTYCLGPADAATRTNVATIRVAARSVPRSDPRLSIRRRRGNDTASAPPGCAAQPARPSSASPGSSHRSSRACPAAPARRGGSRDRRTCRCSARHTARRMPQPASRPASTWCQLIEPGSRTPRVREAMTKSCVAVQDRPHQRRQQIAAVGAVAVEEHQHRAGRHRPPRRRPRRPGRSRARQRNDHARRRAGATAGVPSRLPLSATMIWRAIARGISRDHGADRRRLVQRRDDDGDARRTRNGNGRVRAAPRLRLHRRPQFAHGFGGASPSSAPRNA